MFPAFFSIDGVVVVDSIRETLRPGCYHPRMTTCFIADVHLSAERPDIEQRFLEFLGGLPGRVAALHILGDLFDYWVGDDGAEQLGYGPVLDALAQLAASGVALHVMHGNRDFLLGEVFYHRTGARREDDPSVLAAHGRRVLLCHGDSLCSDDVTHQQSRQRCRDPEWQRQLLQKPLAERLELAREVRRLSAGNISGNAPEIMDVTESAVEDAFRQSGTRWMIHGHTHRPGHSLHRVDGQSCTRVTLGDWYEQQSMVYMTDEAVVPSFEDH